MCSFAGCVFLAGGKSEHDLSIASCEVYNTQSCEWAEVASMNTKRSSFSLTYFQNKVWAVGGVSNGKVLDKIETYDIDMQKSICTQCCSSQQKLLCHRWFY